MTREKTRLPQADYLRACFSYDRLTGELRWKTRPAEHFVDAPHAASWNANYAGKIAGSRHIAGYVELSLDWSRFLAHRVIWKIMTGKDPVCEIDHDNLDRSDNRWDNLREATESQNKMNRNVPSHSKTGIKGVRLLPGGRYAAHIKMDGRFKHLGTFATAEEARAMRDEIARKLHGEFFNPG